MNAIKTSIKHILNLGYIDINKDTYVKRSEVIDILKGQDSIDVENNDTYVETEYPSTLDIVKKAFTLKSTYAFLLLFMFLCIDNISSFFGFEIVIPKGLFEFIKIAFILFGVNIFRRLATYYYSAAPDIYDSTSPNPKKIIKYVGTAYLTYVTISAFLFIFSVNFEALGVKVIKDVLGAYCILIFFLGIISFVLSKWFSPIFDFWISTKDVKHDLVGGWSSLEYKDKVWISLVILGVLLGSLTLLFGYLSVL